MTDFFFNRDRLRIMLGVWLGVYPAVVVIAYAMEPLSWPLWLSTLCSTAVTVPLISYVVVPLCREAIAALDHRPSEDIDG